ncbi:MAG: Ig-like domain-containing protein [Nocardioides sp.]
MSVARAGRPTRSGRSRWLLTSATAVGAVLLAACTPSSSQPGVAQSPDSPGSPSASSAPTPPPPDPVRVVLDVGEAPRAVPLDQAVRLTTSGGTLRSVTVTSPAGRLPGRLAPDSTSWRATGRLEPGLDYLVRSVAVRSDGAVRRTRSRFHTVDLTLDQQTYPSVAPLQGETVGVGMPVIVTFDIPVRDKAAFERHMRVTSTPKQPGAWHWISDREVHWRPKTYWRAGTDVSVDVDVNSIPAGGGVFGQESRHVDFHIGNANIYKVNAQTHQMQVFANGSLVRTIPITTGKPGFTTRSGVKVIIEKFRTKQMNSETVGIAQDNPEYYNIDDVEYAMRVTYSGEFIHAAPWSVGSQGYANVSHGCTGMSTSNAAWLYGMSKRGDVVEYTGTDRWMTLTNGYGDWNESFADYAQGSALHR